MKVKVCGLNDVSNVTEVLQLQPNFIGLIFHDKSPRNCTMAFNAVRDLNLGTIKKVGVFVNEPKDKLLRTVNEFGLDYVQLHGGESVAYCKELIASGLKLIKVFSIDDSFDMNDTNAFQFCDYLLFDTKGKNPGGNGIQFNWGVLNKYKGAVPFILSGGLELKHLSSLQEISQSYPLLSVLDINSKFEITPGLKNIDLVGEFIKGINMNKHV
jgi:phosphoribosylanthranilate isomerase